MSVQLSRITRRDQNILDASLQNAVSRRQLEETARLIEARANVNCRDDLLGWTPLQDAVAKQWVSGCHLLMQHGADIGVIDYAPDLAFLTKCALSQGHQMGTSPFVAQEDDAIDEEYLNKRREMQIALCEKNLNRVYDLIINGTKLTSGQTDLLHPLLENSICNACGGFDYSKLITLIKHSGISRPQADSLLFVAITMMNQSRPETSYVYSDQAKIMRSLIDAGANKDLGLSEAIKGNKPGSALFLLDELHATASEDALRLALNNGCNRIVQYLIQYGVIPSEDILRIAIERKNDELIGLFLRKGAIPNDDTLRAAVKDSPPELIDRLLKKGAIPSEDTLRIAAERGESEIVCLLIGKVVTLNENVLRIAVQFTLSDTVRYILDKGITPNVEILNIAIKNHNDRIVRMLLQEGAIPNEDSLRIAVECCNTDAVYYCLQNVTSIYKKATLDEMLQLAIEKDNENIIRLLLDKGATPNEEMVRLLDRRGKERILCLLFKDDYITYYQNNNFDLIYKVNRQFINKPIFLHIRSDFDGNDAINKYFMPSYRYLHDKISRHFTLLKATVSDPENIPSLIDRVKTVLPGLPILHCAINGHGNNAAIGFSSRRFTVTDTSLMQKIGQRIDQPGTISLWGCNNGYEDHNLAQTFSQYVSPTIVFASPEEVGNVTPNIVKLAAKTPVFIPFFQNDYGKPELLKAYRAGEEIVDGYQLPSRL